MVLFVKSALIYPHGLGRVKKTEGVMRPVSAPPLEKISDTIAGTRLEVHHS